MLEIINIGSQTVSASGTVSFTSASIIDGAGRIVLSGGNSIQIKTPGKYKVDGIFTVYNSTAAAVTVNLQLYANGTAVTGTGITVTIPETGYSEVVIDKVIPVIAAVSGNVATLTFVSSTGATITNALVDVVKI